MFWSLIGLYYILIHAVLILKGQMIPSNGAGRVVILDDVGGYLGPKDGLLCVTNYSDSSAQYWPFSNGTRITWLPRVGVFGVNTIHMGKGVSY